MARYTPQLKLSKDEAVLFFYLLSEARYELKDNPAFYGKEEQKEAFKALSNYLSKIEEFTSDERRNGRRNTSSFSDSIKRIVDKYS